MNRIERSMWQTELAAWIDIFIVTMSVLIIILSATGVLS